MSKKPKTAKSPKTRGNNSTTGRLGATKSSRGFAVKDRITGQLLYSDELITESTTKAEGLRQQISRYPSLYLNGHSQFDYEFELSNSMAIVTAFYPESMHYERDVYKGSFAYSKGLMTGKLDMAAHAWVSFETGEYDEVIEIAKPQIPKISFKGLWFDELPTSLSRILTTSMIVEMTYTPSKSVLPSRMTNDRSAVTTDGDLARLLAEGWWQNPFAPNLI